MKKVYSAENSGLVGFLKDVLEQHAIPCVLKNQYLSGAAGELSPIDVWPEIWVSNDEDYERAQQLIESTLAEESKRSPWTCASCGEHIEGQFAACWNCATERKD
ncbi:MAG: DUF2007 domain-containing protein [Pseudomonadales bacterium]